MKFGIHHPSWRYGNGDPAEIFEGTKARAIWAEEHGYTWFSVMDHLIQIGMAGPPDEPFMESWTILSALAAVTKRIRLAPLVTSVHYRNPAHLAKIAAGVDQISRGRLTFGIGAGWLEAEYKQYGWEFPPKPATRIAQMEEAIKLIRAMWTEKRATFHGKWFHCEDAILEPKPVQKPHPPIMIGGSGEQLTLRAVARHANACNLFGPPDMVRQKLEVLKRHCEAEKRDYNEIERTNTIGFLIARDEAALAAKRQRLDVPAQYMGVAGTVAQIADLVGKYKDAGSQLLIYSTWRNDPETHELMASEIMPKFKA
jgi:F420-dependent oxidoreductase-like protein